MWTKPALPGPPSSTSERTHSYGVNFFTSVTIASRSGRCVEGANIFTFNTERNQNGEQLSNDALLFNGNINSTIDFGRGISSKCSFLPARGRPFRKNASLLPAEHRIPQRIQQTYQPGHQHHGTLLQLQRVPLNWKERISTSAVTTPSSSAPLG